MQQAQDAQIAVAHEDLGWRIVQVATLALLAHLSETSTRQQRLAGGAGRKLSMDGSLPLSAEGDAA